MKYMTSAEIREKYLKYFEDKGCKRMPSSSLIPDDPSLLLTSAGMVQFKPYFLHQKEFDDAYIGATTAQKCVRTNDIDIIGTTGRHQSFFEMLGNFSFGKYFKKEMCAWAYDFSTNPEYLGLPAEKLYFTVFETDEETIEIWKELGVPDDHISRLGEEDNFWRAGPTGPCGPCSEIYFDQGPEVGCGSPDCAPGCDCDRFLEYWNCVFTQYDGQEDGTLAPLITKNIDTGMGLERIAGIMQGVTSNYETDILRSLVAIGEKLSGKTYGEDSATDLALRIMADHSRSVTFMIADGIIPSNEGRGYVLRRLLRRAVMKGNLIGVEGTFLNEYIDEIVKLMGEHYPEIVEKRETIRQFVLSEEERFGATLHHGQNYLEEALASLEGTVLPGKTAFVLHDTYGFPVEVTQEMCADRGIEVDMDEFRTCMAEQRDRARAANVDDAQAAWSTFGGVHADLLKELGPTKFVGYENLETEAKIVALVANGQSVDSVPADGADVEVFLDTTTFYAEMGGEVGDTGVIRTAAGEVEVSDTKAPQKGLNAHMVKATVALAVGDQVTASVDAERRLNVTRNHTATHVLHAALRKVLGTHVNQAGSYVGPDRLRFDFTHFEAMTAEQISAVEAEANQFIMSCTATNIYETSLDEARKSGVTALFGEKYGETVRVVEAGEFSRELCGGCHVANTSQIGFVKVVGETSVGANTRRIEAVTGPAALEYVNKIESELKATAAELKVSLFDVAERTDANLKAFKGLQAESRKAKEAAADTGIAAMLEGVFTAAAGYPVVVASFGTSAIDAAGMRNAWDVIRSRMTAPGAAVLAGVNEGGKPVLLAAGTDESVAAGFNAGAIIKAIAPKVAGGGGGKPTMAQAGGKDASGIDAALAEAKAILS